MSSEFDHEAVEAEIVPSTATSVAPLTARDRAEIDIQVNTAHAFPRSISRFLKDAETMIRESQTIAEGCFYSLPRAGKMITGPSIRLAEIAASGWGNMRLQVTIGQDDGRQVMVNGLAWDLETNVAIAIPVVRRIVDRTGRRYSDDMVVNAINSGASVALRNAITRVIPRAYIEVLEQTARRTAAGDIKTLPTRRAECLEWLHKRGAKDEAIFRVLTVSGIEDIGLDELSTLQGIVTALREGTVTLEDAFPTNGDGKENGKAPDAAPTAQEQVRARVRQAQTKQQEAPTPPAEAKPETPPDAPPPADEQAEQPKDEAAPIPPVNEPAERPENFTKLADWWTTQGYITGKTTDMRQLNARVLRDKILNSVGQSMEQGQTINDLNPSQWAALWAYAGQKV